MIDVTVLVLVVQVVGMVVDEAVLLNVVDIGEFNVVDVGVIESMSTSTSTS